MPGGGLPPLGSAPREDLPGPADPAATTPGAAAALVLIRLVAPGAAYGLDTRLGRRRPEDEGARFLADLSGVIERFGWGVLHLGAGPSPAGPRLSYTVGLTALGHPEVVAVGLPFEAAEGYLNMVGTSVRSGSRSQHGSRTARFTDPDSPVVFIRAEDTSRLTAVEELYGRVDALQMIWPDPTGKVPWEEGHRNAPQVQPLLGPRPVG